MLRSLGRKKTHSDTSKGAGQHVVPKGVIWRQAFIAVTNISICPMKTYISDE
jgi:hypothetical protein